MMEKLAILLPFSLYYDKNLNPVSGFFLTIQQKNYSRYYSYRFLEKIKNLQLFVPKRLIFCDGQWLANSEKYVVTQNKMLKQDNDKKVWFFGHSTLYLIMYKNMREVGRYTLLLDLISFNLYIFTNILYF